MQFEPSPTADSKSFLIISYALVEGIDGSTILMLWTSSKAYPLSCSFPILNFFIRFLAAICVLLFQHRLSLYAKFLFSVYQQYGVLLFQHRLNL